MKELEEVRFLLGISENATEEEIINARRGWISQNHPDHHIGNKDIHDKRTREMQIINKSHKRLIAVAQRRQSDEAELAAKQEADDIRRAEDERRVAEQKAREAQQREEAERAARQKAEDARRAKDEREVQQKEGQATVGRVKQTEDESQGLSTKLCSISRNATKHRRKLVALLVGLAIVGFVGTDILPRIASQFSGMVSVFNNMTHKFPAIPMEHGTYGFIKDKNGTTIRTSPSPEAKEHLKSRAFMHNDAFVLALSSATGSDGQKWDKVRFDGHEGWIRSSRVAWKDVSTASWNGSINGNYIILRPNPDRWPIKAPQNLPRLQNGEKVVVLGLLKNVMNHEWLYVNYKGQKGWIDRKDPATGKNYVVAVASNAQKRNTKSAATQGEQKTPPTKKPSADPIEKGNQYMQKGDFELAAKSYKEALSKNLNNTQAKTGLKNAELAIEREKSELRKKEADEITRKNAEIERKKAESEEKLRIERERLAEEKRQQEKLARQKQNEAILSAILGVAAEAVKK
ncbi:hypothetical protein FACS1894216_21160 [Synergistales bacterium]|nr:hypothetical protein FACS1894216_21160 [Synergistales bacterium]